MRAPAKSMPATSRDRAGDALRIAATAALAAGVVLAGPGGRAGDHGHHLRQGAWRACRVGGQWCDLRLPSRGTGLPDGLLSRAPTFAGSDEARPYGSEPGGDLGPGDAVSEVPRSRERPRGSGISAWRRSTPRCSIAGGPTNSDARCSGPSVVRYSRHSSCRPLDRAQATRAGQRRRAGRARRDAALAGPLVDAGRHRPEDARAGAAGAQILTPADGARPLGPSAARALPVRSPAAFVHGKSRDRVDAPTCRPCPARRPRPRPLPLPPRRPAAAARPRSPSPAR